MAIAVITLLQHQCQKTDSTMKTKHRRLFGQNNRNALHFFLLSAGIDKYLNISVKIMLGVMSSALIATPVNAATMSLEAQIDDYVAHALAQQYPEIDSEDLQYTVNLAISPQQQKQCSEELAFDWRGDLNAGANTLNVSCSQPLWQVYVPVSLAIYKQVVVAATPLSRQNRIVPSQLATQRMDIGTLRMGYFTKPESLEGFELQRTVKSGQVITPYIAKAPALVQRGDWVTILSGRGALTVSTTGEALKDGVLGEQIPVRNLRSEQTIRAWIIQKGVVSTKKGQI